MDLINWHENRLWYLDKYQTLYGLTHIHRMVVIRLANNALLIHNPVELTAQLQEQISLLGAVKSVVCTSPNYHHHLSEWWLSYPDALFYATPTSIQKRSDLNFDGALSNYSQEIWKNELFQTALLGFDKPRKFLFCDPISHTLLLNDDLWAVQSQLPLGQKLLTWSHGINRELKLSYSDRRALNNMTSLRSSVQEVMTWPFERLISSNGLIVEQDAKKSFYQAFWWAF
jgi:hypothetical protein